MSIRDSGIIFTGKLLLAALSLLALVALPARELMPTVSLGLLLLYVAAGVVGVLALLTLAAICSLQFAQFILRIGGSDPQWFWFSSEPRGLVALRKGKVVDIEERHHAS